MLSLVAGKWAEQGFSTGLGWLPMMEGPWGSRRLEQEVRYGRCRWGR